LELLLIRHGQSANNALPESQRVPDPGLTELGARQALKLAEWLRGRPPSKLYCSAFRRALETTAPIAAALSLKPTVRWDLFEQGGCYAGWTYANKRSSAGLNRRQIASAFGEWELDPRIGDAGWYHGKPLETRADAVRRAQAVVKWIQEELLPKSKVNPEYRRVALIIHADFKSLLLENLDHDESFSNFRKAYSQSLEPWNTSVSEVHWRNERRSLVAYNEVRHLNEVEITS
jgi:2,3-bisphosphoglycerate-dependent phosphoglycerate mutase